MYQYCVHVVIDCGSLDDLGNGHVSLTGTTFGSTATYECAVGLYLIGDSQRTCLETGQWSGEQPVCQSKLLPKPVSHKYEYTCML